MAEEGRTRPRIHNPDEPHPTPGRSMADLADAVKRMDEELARQVRCYEDAHVLQHALGTSIHDVMTEVAGLEARRDALAKEIGDLEAQLIALKADVAQAKAGA